MKKRWQIIGVVVALGLSLLCNVYFGMGYRASWPLFQPRVAGLAEAEAALEERDTRLWQCIEALAGERPESWQAVSEIMGGKRSPARVAAIPGAAAVAAGAGAAAASKAPGRLVILGLDYSPYSETIDVLFNGSDEVPAPEDISSAVQIEPAVADVQVRRSYGGRWILDGAFQPETVYTFTFRKGLSSRSGAQLQADAVYNLRTPPLGPQCRFLTKGPYYPGVDATGRVVECRLPVSVRNIATLSVTLSRYHEANLSPFQGDSWRGQEKTRLTGELEKSLTLPANTDVTMDFNIAEMFPDLTPGVYQLEMSDANSYACDSIHLVISDMAIMVVRDDPGRQVRVIVRRLSDGSAVSDAQVRLFSDKNVPMAQGDTDAQGSATLVYAPAFTDENDAAAVVVVQKGAESSYLLLDGGSEHNLSVFNNRGRRYRYGATAFVYTERGVCRPGEAMTVSAWLRDGGADGFRVMGQVPLVVTVLDPQGRVLTTERLTTDSHGFASVPLSVPRNARTGAYTVRCGLDNKSIWGSCAFLVAEYVPDRVKVSLQSSREQVATTEALTLTADAKYYFGAPLPIAVYSFYVQAERARPPAHWSGFSVGDADGFSAGRLFAEEGRELPEDGVLSYPGFAAMGGRCHEPVTLLATVSVMEPGGRAVSSSLSLRCEPSATYLGLRYDGSLPGTTQPRLACRVLSWDKNNEPLVKERLYTLKLWRRDWHYVQKLTKDTIRNEWEMRRAVLACPESLSLSRVQGELTLPALASGQYELEATSANGVCTRLLFWHDAGEGGARSANPNVLSFSTDKALYQPGDRAVVTVLSPSPGEIYVVAGEHRLVHGEALPAQAGINTVVIPIAAEALGSQYFAGITLVCRQGETIRSFGLLQLPLDQSRRRLQLSLDAPDEALPGETIRIAASLQTHDGVPSAGLVQIFAVDEGILALTNYRTPDIHDFFYGRYYCGFQFYDLFGRVFPRVKIAADGSIGGDGGMGALTKLLGEIKSQAPAIVLLGALAVPESGTVQASLALPKHLGAMRLMAVASAAEAVGSAERQITLRDVISVVPSAPRALATGDECELSFMVSNHDCPDGEYALTVPLPATLTALSATSFTGTLARGASQVQTLRCQAAATAGAVELVCKLSMGAVQNEARLPLTIRAANPPISAVELRQLRPGDSMQVAAVAEQWSGMPALRLRVSASAAIGLPQAMNWLNHYPYGCLEQTTAMAFPFLAVDSLVRAGAIPAAVGATAQTKIADAGAAILSLMLTDGAFAAWPGSSVGWTDATVFAQHFLLAAEGQKLLELDPYSKYQICRSLRQLADKGSAEPVLRAHACYALALAGDDAFASSARNLLAAEKPGYGALWASAALIKGGYAAEGMRHLERALAAEVWRDSDGMGSFSDAASRYGCALALLMDLQPRHQATSALALALQGMLKADVSAWGTTQANAWVSTGLAAYAVEYGCGRAVGTLSLASGKAIPINTDRYFEMELPAAETGTLVNTGGQPFLVQLIVDGVPRSLASHSGALKIRRAYLDADGKEVSRAVHGQLLQVFLTVEGSGEVDNLVLVDLLPGGLEIEDPRLATRSAALPPADDNALLQPEFLERRDDRFLFFGRLAGHGVGTVSYTVRAVSRGKFVIPPLRAEAMYDPGVQATFVPDGHFEVQ